MYRTLFSIGGVNVDSYYVIWAIALCLMMYWTRRRCVSSYGISFDDASDVLLWTIFGVFIGATLGGYLDNWSRYTDSPRSMLYIWQSGVSSGPGFIGGGLAGLYKLKKLSLSVNCFADAAAAPCSFMLFVGRWGCFLNGCCSGVATTSMWGVSFPQKPLVKVFPSQLFESFAALFIGLLLVLLERMLHRTPDRVSRGAILWPNFLILYGAYRFAFDFIRAGDRIIGLRVGQYTGLVAIFVGAAWLAFSIVRNRRNGKIACGGARDAA
ncbi:MAG: prolipoprotein diacylglyceryl transferase [Synergistaceae bacterium]|jgi:phosphatidylglycerol:prolipoprotein diacylglycerol transferase|nr:prolipoprotein diacylglyceryl transferase [Synergistaceae bacterium]